ncbi:MAG: NADP-specific glutamate dehydrogenase [Defluviitaleaceae bacterium]|nr:NADP-specific glutamate dehydrogenase [Defluviitaleaceae bacterium]MCL2262887.1 NADP-specific glutamate dehydrogenase [Defluviitaleaceae bacterium]
MSYTKNLIQEVIGKTPGESEFHQAMTEVFSALAPVVDNEPKYQEAGILKKMSIPERAIVFRVPWLDDKNQVQVNTAYRVQFSSAIGPYKGGMRFHPSVNLSVLKFLGFEQVFKNSLTGLPIGGGKGGADFDPKGKSDAEVMRFCQSLMTELCKYLGPDEDVPAGDIGVGAREVGYMYGQYKRIVGRYEGILTGKGLTYGGSLGRTEATGYGLLYLMDNILKGAKNGFDGKKCSISGSGNVAIFAAEKTYQLGGIPITMSDSGGFVHDPDGLDLDLMKDLKLNRRERISEYAKARPSAKYTEGTGLWNVPCDIALPCATQNELHEADAKALAANGCIAVGEGANMPCTAEAVDVFLEKGIFFAPGKAANAGGVAVSCLEMSQNSMRLSWTFEEVDNKLQDIMAGIYQKMSAAAEEYNMKGNFVAGANIAGFKKVAEAMLAQGVV